MDETIAPFTVIIDTREQAPFSFAGLLAASRAHRHVPLIVPTVRQGLPTGDYSLVGHESAPGGIVVERKSAADLFGSLSWGRERFERELARLQEFAWSAVVVEAEWSALIREPPSEMNPVAAYRTVVSWQQRFPKTHWWFCPDRRFAEITTFRILERFWMLNVKRSKLDRGANNDLPAQANGVLQAPDE